MKDSECTSFGVFFLSFCVCIFVLYASNKMRFAFFRVFPLPNRDTSHCGFAVFLYFCTVNIKTI